MWSKAVLVAVLGSVALGKPVPSEKRQSTQGVDIMATGQDPATVSIKTPHVYFNDYVLKIGFTAEMSGSFVTSQNSAKWTPELTNSAALGGSVTIDGITGDLYTVSTTFYRNVFQGFNDTEAMDPFTSDIQFVYTDSTLPNGLDIIFSLLPANATQGDARSILNDFEDAGITQNRQVLYDHKNQLVEFGTSQLTNYGERALASTSPHAANISQKFAYDWHTYYAVQADNTYKVNVTMNAPVTSGPYLASFNLQSPATYLPQDLANQAWAAFNVTGHFDATTGETTYTFNSGVASNQPASGYGAFSFLANGDEAANITVSDANNGRDTGMVESYIIGLEGLEEIIFGTQMLESNDMTTILFNADQDYISFAKSGSVYPQ